MEEVAFVSIDEDAVGARSAKESESVSMDEYAYNAV